MLDEYRDFMCVSLYCLVGSLVVVKGSEHAFDNERKQLFERSKNIKESPPNKTPNNQQQTQDILLNKCCDEPNMISLDIIH